MYTRFYDNTIETKFIKQLVATTNVPFISTWNDGEFAIRGMFYIHNNIIWRCNHTGYPANVLDVCKISASQVKQGLEHIKTVDSMYVKEQYVGVDADEFTNHANPSSVPYFTKIKPYVFGEEYFNITGRYQSKTLGYDPTTHFYLGQYLRMLRDLYDLNLMPFYNCYCGETLSDINFNSDNIKDEKLPDLYKIMSVPVKFGKTYTVALNSSTPVEMVLGIYGPKGLLVQQTENLNDGNANSTYQRFLNMSFNRPILIHTKSWHQLYNQYYVDTYGKISSYEVDNTDSDSYKLINDNTYDQALGQYERYLRLFIKVPTTNNSSLVVLEGDYNVGQSQEMVNTYSVTFTNMSGIDTTVNSRLVTGEWVRPEYIDNGDEIVNKNSPMLYSPLGLLQMDDGNSYAFSNRLIEYLLQHSITASSRIEPPGSAI